jgi:hypothetical protein
MLDLKAVTHEDFAACLNQSFTINDEDAGAFEVELVEVDTYGSYDPEVQSRQPFSLLLRGKSEPVLPQGLYRMRHQQLGEMELFLVPIGPDQQGMRYEAVFT